MSVFWKLSHAIVWIATRDDEAVAEAPGEVLILRLIDANSNAIAEAQRELWRALQTGDLKATGIAPDGERRAIPAERWRDLRPILHGTRETLEPRPHAGASFLEVVALSSDVRKHWSASPLSALSPKSKRGPKSKVDPAKFEAEALCWIGEHGIPDPKLDPQVRQADLERHMMSWHKDAINVTRNRELVRLAMKKSYEGR